MWRKFLFAILSLFLTVLRISSSLFFHRSSGLTPICPFGAVFSFLISAVVSSPFFIPPFPMWFGVDNTVAGFPLPFLDARRGPLRCTEAVGPCVSSRASFLPTIPFAVDSPLPLIFATTLEIYTAIPRDIRAPITPVTAPIPSTALLHREGREASKNQHRDKGGGCRSARVNRNQIPGQVNGENLLEESSTDSLPPQTSKWGESTQNESARVGPSGQK